MNVQWMLFSNLLAQNNQGGGLNAININQSSLYHLVSRYIKVWQIMIPFFKNCE